MTFNPVLSWWVLGPLAAAVVLGLCWILSRTRAQPEEAQPEEHRAWLFRAALVLLLLLAVSRPGLPGGPVQAADTNLNVFFVVDTSSSIAAEDHVSADGGGPRAPRLDGVRADILAVARELGGARYSLLTFDSGAAVRMPLTADTSALETAVAVLAPQVTSYSQGSSVTAARTVLAERLAAARDAQPERPRLVFYFGDGEQTSAAAPQDMRLGGSLVSGGAVLGYGTRDGGRMQENSGDAARPAKTYIQDPATGTDALSRLDEDRLRGIAQQLAVPYVHRASGEGPAPMLQNAAPGTLARTGESLEGRTELYWLPASAAFLLALRETLLVCRELRDLKPARHPATGPNRPLPGEAAPAGSRAARGTAGRGPRT